MSALSLALAQCFGFRRAAARPDLAALPVPAPTLEERIRRDHERALAERRAARPARRHAGEAGRTTAEDRAARLAADPILQNRETYLGARA